MQKLAILLILFFSTSLYARGVRVQWSCSKDIAENISIEVTFNNQGRLQFAPDIFARDFVSLNPSVMSQCVSEFQKKIHDTVTAFKSSSCPTSQDDFCYTSVSYLDGKVLEKLRNSTLLKKNTSITVSPVQSGSSTNTSDTSTGTQTTTDTNTADTNGQSGSGSTSTSPTTAQAYLEDKVAKNEIDLKNLSQQFTFNGQSYKVSDFDEVIGNNIQNIFKDMTISDAKQFAQNYLMAKIDLVKTETPSAQRTLALNNLNKMFAYLYGEKGRDELAKLLECKPEDEEFKEIENILDSLNETRRVTKCQELKPGEHKVFEHDQFYSSGSYLLRRTREGDYQIALNVEFTQAGGQVSPAQMLSRVKGCAAQASQAMIGPNGQRMKFEILSPAEASRLPADQRPDPRRVSIHGPNHNTNAAEYAENVDCGVITHELFHLLGLCDEYKEDRAIYSHLNWTCRVETKAPSIMRSTSVFGQAVPQTLNCSCTNEICRGIMSSNNENVKKIYTGADFYDFVPQNFRTSYCRQVTNTVFNFTNIPRPDRAAYLRSETPNSIIIENRRIGMQAEPPYYYPYRDDYKCECPIGSVSCLAELARIKNQVKEGRSGQYCPSHTNEVSRVAGKTEGGPVLRGNNLVFSTDPTIPSLLQPAHFNKILAGNCAGRGADNYNRCASFAYDSPPCNVPPECRNDSYYLGTPQ